MIEVICGIFISLGDFVFKMIFEYCFVRKTCCFVVKYGFENDNIIKDNIVFFYLVF